MLNKYKEKIKNDWGIARITIKGRKKGMLIYQDRRNNHLEGMVQFVGDEEVLLEEHDYLVFDIPEDIDPSHFTNNQIHRNGWFGVQLRWFNGWTEVACHHPQIFHCGILNKLEELGYITVIQKEIPSDKLSYPYYVNPQGWQVAYNLINQIREGIKKGGFKLSNHLSKEEVEQEPEYDLEYESEENVDHKVEKTKEKPEEKNVV